MSKNTMKTGVLLAALGGFFVLVGGAIGGRGGTTIGLAVAFVFVGGSYWFSDKIAVAAARGRAVTAADAPELHAMVSDLAQRADMPMPRLYVSPMEQPNAFATGRSPNKAAVCVTEGILAALPPEELRGVLAHELAHVRNRDILISSVAAAIATAIMFLARMAMFGAMFGGGDDDDGGVNPIALILMMVLAPLGAMLLQAAISRSREFEADRSGAHLLGDGEPLARALEKIDTYARRIPADVNPAQASLYIVNPLTGRKVNFAGLFSTHPPTEERIARLRQQV
jgi:heat shock protein HtpX